MEGDNDVNWVARVLSGEARCGRNSFQSAGSNHRSTHRSNHRSEGEKLPARFSRKCTRACGRSDASAAPLHRSLSKGTCSGSQNQAVDRRQIKAHHDASASARSSSQNQDVNLDYAARLAPPSAHMYGHTPESLPTKHSAQQLRRKGKSKSENSFPAQPGRKIECKLCGCWVFGSDSGWQTHVNGIAHRQQVLSLRETGELGHSFASVFQSEAPMAARRSSAISSEQLWDIDRDLLQAVSARLRIECLNYGCQDDYSRWEQLSESRALAFLVEHLALCIVSEPEVVCSTPRIAPTSSHSPHHNRTSVQHDAAVRANCTRHLQLQCNTESGLNQWKFAVAALPLVAALTDSCHGAFTHLDIRVGDGLAPMPPVVCAGIAALGNSLYQGRMPGLEHLSITVPELSTDYTAAILYRAVVALLQMASRGIAACTSVLRSISIEVRSLQDISLIQHAANDFNSRIQSLAISQRTAILLGYLQPSHTTRRTTGRKDEATDSKLWMLDRDTMAMILKEGAPLQPCSLSITTRM